MFPFKLNFQVSLVSGGGCKAHKTPLPPLLPYIPRGYVMKLLKHKSENPVLTFKILFWHSHWGGTSYLDHSKSYFDIRTELKILFWHSKSYFDIRTESEYPILTFKILFKHSHWVGKSYFDIQNPILTYALSRKILFWQWKSYFNIRTEAENQNH